LRVEEPSPSCIRFSTAASDMTLLALHMHTRTHARRERERKGEEGGEERDQPRRRDATRSEEALGQSEKLGRHAAKAKAGHKETQTRRRRPQGTKRRRPPSRECW
jgi:hypothetical protein